MSAAWPTVPLGDVVEHRKEFIIIDDLQTYRRPRVQLHAQGVVLRDAVPGAEIKTKKQQVARAGEFLVAEIDAKVGGFGIVPDDLDGSIVSSHYFLYGHRRGRLDNKYLGWFVKTRAFRQQVSAQGSTNYAAIRPDDVLRYEIPLPPLDEQRRIVARIETVAVRVEEARRLREIATRETAALVPAYLGTGFRNLADHYPVHPLDELSSHIIDGPHQTPSYLLDKSGVPFVTVKNMVTGKLSFDYLNYVSTEDHREFTKRCRAERGDVLYSKDGATKGRPCYVDTDDEFSFFVSVALIKPLRDRLDGRYLVHLLNSSWIKDRMIERSRGDMIPHIVLREIRAFPVPLPPLDKQREIIEKLDALQAKVDAMKALQEGTAVELEAIFPAILDRAFKGEL
jgi:type I restriction enzyme, S subunit